MQSTDLLGTTNCYVTEASTHSPGIPETKEAQTRTEMPLGKILSVAKFSLGLNEKLLSLFKTQEEYEKLRKECGDICEQQKIKKESSLAELESTYSKKPAKCLTTAALLEAEAYYRGVNEKLEAIYFDNYMADFRFDVCKTKCLDLLKKCQILRAEIAEFSL